MMPNDNLERFRIAYAEHRRREGHHAIDVTNLPYVNKGPLRKMWSVRARSYETLIGSVIQPHEHRTQDTLTVVDVGAGNGWLSMRMNERGHTAIALDWRSDDVDGLNASTSDRASCIKVVSDFLDMPLRDKHVDICIFNASFHYTRSVYQALAESVRITRPGGRIVIVDTPFYRSRDDGDKMVQAKREQAENMFGDLAADLTSIDFVEFLTPDILAHESKSLGVTWIRHRVRYPLWYETRPLIAWFKRERTPSRFDVWEGVVSG